MSNTNKENSADRRAGKNKGAIVSSDAASDEKRTTLSLSLTASDKKALKLMALEKNTTMAAIIHEWVQEHFEEVEN